ncbi:MAG: polyribonucleotide nucleotidyltransferase, partial [Cytophagales bacterium]|nr:polyribonucleotide nucleotidyltransferase [Cytophagales bacterium]
MSEFYSRSVFIPGYDEVKVSTGKLARNTDGSVLIETENIILLATVVYCKKKISTDFFPLLVEYREKYSAIGKIPSGFLKREMRLTDREILISRLVDRTLRPMFDKNFNGEIQVCINLLSANSNSIPDYLICFAASLAIYSSNLPFSLPVANVCVAKVNDKYILNPDFSALKQSILSITVGGNKNGIIMLEGNMNEVPNAKVIETIKFAQEEIVKLCDFQENFVAKLNIQRLQAEKENFPTELENVKNEVKKIFLEEIAVKRLRNKNIDRIVEKYVDGYPKFENLLEEIKKNVLHEIAFEHGKRIDGRNFDEVRAIECEVGNLPGSHGSALFTRGGTQALVSVSLGSKLDEFHSDSILGNKSDNCVVHYNFYGFATAEIKSLDKKISRRELGHGGLAMKSLKCVLPNDDENPFTIRIVSDI